MSKPKFYFTNPTADRAKCRKVLEQIERSAVVELHNPFYNRAGNPTDEIRKMDRGLPCDVSNAVIVSDDMHLIRKLDGIIAYITNKTSWGSIQECCIAFRELGKPVYIIWDEHTRGKCPHCNGFNPNHPGHPWAEEHCTQSFGTLEGFINFAIKKWGTYDRVH